MRSHLAWSVQSARLWQQEPQHLMMADWSTDPIRLADYSHGAEVEAALIDVGSGTAEQDYAGKDVRGKIVLADGVLPVVQALAVMKFGAAGIVSDMRTSCAGGISMPRCRRALPSWFRMPRQLRCAHKWRRETSSRWALTSRPRWARATGPW
jgi:hypothetical protein